MKKTNLTKMLLWLMLSILFTTTTYAQAQNLKLDPNTSTIIINGISNLHNWDSKATKISGEFALTNSKQVQALSIKIPVKSIKSGNGLMDNKTYEAFDADKNPFITFQLTEPASPVLTSEKDVQVTLTGNLSMAGVTRKISFKSIGKSTNAGVYKFSASVPIKMSDYKMSAPTAMFGALKVGDAVTLKLDITVLAVK